MTDLKKRQEEFRNLMAEKRRQKHSDDREVDPEVRFGLKEIYREGFCAYESSPKYLKIVEVLKSVMPYLNHSEDHLAVTAVYFTPAAQLRRAAEELEQKDAVINRARDLLKELGEK